MNKTDERKKQLLELLSAAGRIDVKSIVNTFNISEATARRMFSELEAEGSIIRTHGGIALVHPRQQEYLYDVLAVSQIEEKRKIGEYAASLVEDNDIVFLESGTTVHQVACSLVSRIKSGSLKNIKVFTNSLTNIDLLASVIKLNVIGGEYRPERKDFNGFIGERAIRNLRFNKCFIGADAINPSDGVMAIDVDTVRFDELLISRSEKAIVVADSSKFMKSSLLSYAQIDQISAFITDAGLNGDVCSSFSDLNISLVRV